MTTSGDKAPNWTNADPLGQLHAAAAKLVYNWRVLPSGSLTGICDDGIITTSALIQPSTAKSNTIVVTASGSQYKLMGDPIGGENPFAKSLSSSVIPTPSTSGDRDTTSLTTTISFVALIAASGIFAAVVLQKLGFIDDSILNNIYDLSARSVVLIVYCIGIAIASIQLINDVNKVSKT
jgi:hypothetical protein